MAVRVSSAVQPSSRPLARSCTANSLFSFAISAIVVALVTLQFFSATKQRWTFAVSRKERFIIPTHGYGRREEEGFEQARNMRRNQTAELLFLIHGASGESEMEMERKRQECHKNGMLFADDKILPETFARYGTDANPPGTTTTTTSSSGNDIGIRMHTIPKIFHITCKTRCLTQPFYDNLERWKSIPGYSLLFHDDDAIYRLFQSSPFLSSSDELPKMEYILACMKNRGAMLADLWRYLILYEYGGFYVDIDEAPGDLLLAPNDPDEFFQPDSRDAFLIWYPKGASIAQYFLALSPKHPFLFYTLLATFGNLYSSPDILRQYVPYVTGTTTNTAWRMLMRGAPCTPGIWHIANQMVANRSMDIIHKEDAARYIVRDPPWLSGAVEKEYYKKINATDYERNWGVVQASSNGVHCWDMLYDVHVKKSGTILNLVSKKENGDI